MKKVKTLNGLKKEISLNGLFTKGGTITNNKIWTKKIRYDLGKYQVPAKIDVTEIPEPIWYTIQSDKTGKYTALWCINDLALNQAEKIEYNRIKEIYNTREKDNEY